MRKSSRVLSVLTMLSVLFCLSLITVHATECVPECGTPTPVTCDYTCGAIAIGPDVIPPPAINYQTGNGYCTKSINPGGVIFDLSACDRYSDLVVGQEYNLYIEIEIDGFSFVLPPCPATNIDIGIIAYPCLQAVCDGIGGVPLSLNAGTNGKRIKTENSTGLVIVQHPILVVSIPDMVYDKSLVTADCLIVSVKISNPNGVCTSCDSYICRQEFRIGELSCLNNSIVYPYLPINDSIWWSGIAVCNLNSEMGKMEIVVRCNEGVYVIEKTLAGNSEFVTNVDELIDGLGITCPSCSIVINGNFSMYGVGTYGSGLGASSAYIACPK